METLLKALSIGGGRSGGSSFLFNGTQRTVTPGSVADSGTVESIIYAVPPPSSWNYQGLATTSLGTDNIVQYLTGVYIVPATTLASSTNYAVNLRIYRAGALVNTGSTLFAGWASFPDLTAMTPVLMPWNASNTSVIAPYGQKVGSTSVAITNVGLVGLQPLDVVTLFFNNTSGGAVTFPSSTVVLEVV